MRGERYLSAAEAARELGVSVRTLYAYVSRGLVRSEAGGGKRRDRRYRAEDVRRLKERKEQRRDPDRVAGRALDWGTPVMESGISLIDDGRLYYRGRDAIALAGRCSLEQVAGLIWTGEMSEGERLPRLFREPGRETFRVPMPDPGVGSTISQAETFGIGLQIAGAGDPGAYDLRPGPVARTGARILNLLVALASGGTRDGGETAARALGRRRGAGDKAAVGLINRALVLCADHELNVSAFTARCVASAGATPYAVVVAGLAALGGVKHGGNTERVEAFLMEAEASGDARGVVASRLRRGDSLPGFGHPLYPEGDPRGRSLLDALAAAYPTSEARGLVAEVVAAAEDLTGEKPNVDLGLVALARVVGLPPGGALTLFALGRTVGWIGHAIEQYGEAGIIRPRARYVGKPPVSK